MNLDQLEQKLEQTYCGTISAEFDTVSVSLHGNPELIFCDVLEAVSGSVNCRD